MDEILGHYPLANTDEGVDGGFENEHTQGKFVWLIMLIMLITLTRFLFHLIFLVYFSVDENNTEDASEDTHNQGLYFKLLPIFNFDH